MINKSFKKRVGGKWTLKKFIFYPLKIIKCILDWFYRPNILYAKGSHIITGFNGSGKSLLLSHLINSVDSTKYFWLCNMKEYNQDNVKTFNIDDVFNDKKQQLRFPKIDEKGRKLYAIIFDEINLKFNRRDNKTTAYNTRFLGLMEFLVARRHQGIERIYFIGQRINLQDAQVFSMFQYQHDIFQKKETYIYYWWRWLKYLKAEDKRKVFKYFYRIPKYIRLVNLYKSIDDDVFIPGDEIKVKLQPNDFIKYDTHALNKDYEGLPLVKVS